MQKRNSTAVRLLLSINYFVVKIILRGAEGVGKTSLFEVFQGRSCPEEHKPSKQIKTTNVLWTNPISKERVKVNDFC